MKKRVVICLALIATMMLFINGGYADGNRVELGDLGIYFTVDSKYDIITNDNKEEYSQTVQQFVIYENQVLAYAEGYGAVVVIYDQGKNIQQYDFSNKKADELPYFYDKMLNLDETAKVFGDYELSVYDSGTIKWRVARFPAANVAIYGTVCGDKLVAVMFQMLRPDINEIEAIVDSFEFGSPSFWTVVKSLAGKITDFSRDIMGGYGVYIVWSTIIGIGITIIITVVAGIGAIIKKIFG